MRRHVHRHSDLRPYLVASPHKTEKTAKLFRQITVFPSLTADWDSCVRWECYLPVPIDTPVQSPEGMKLAQ